MIYDRLQTKSDLRSSLVCLAHVIYCFQNYSGEPEKAAKTSDTTRSKNYAYNLDDDESYYIDLSSSGATTTATTLSATYTGNGLVNAMEIDTHYVYTVGNQGNILRAPINSNGDAITGAFENRSTRIRPLRIGEIDKATSGNNLYAAGNDGNIYRSFANATVDDTLRIAETGIFGDYNTIEADGANTALVSGNQTYTFTDNSGAMTTVYHSLYTADEVQDAWQLP